MAGEKALAPKQKKHPVRGAPSTAASKIKIVDKHAQALQLRIAGASLQVIADALGYAGPQGASEAIKSAMQKTLQEPADQLRKLELERLDRMLRGIWTTATDSGQNPIDPSVHHSAIDRALRIMERRARLLGLDAPTKIAGEDGGPITIRVVYDLQGVKEQLDGR